MDKKSSKLELIFSIAVIILLSILTLTFFYLYIGSCEGFLLKNKVIINSLVTAVLAILTAVAIIFQLNDKTFVFRLLMITLLLSSFVMFVLYLLKISGFWEKVDSVEDMRNFISGAGSFAVIVFILMQILQVLALPLPGVVPIGAGVALFGALKGGIFSFIGIMLGSVIAFFIGRVLGYKAVKWLVGDSVDKTLEMVKGKDKVVLSFMFLFPFFPDDILCFVSGLSSMSVKYFLIVITITRLISVFLTSFSVSGVLIPYNTWWGIMIWIVLFVATLAITVLIYKKGEKIEKFFLKKFSKRKEG